MRKKLLVCLASLSGLAWGANSAHATLIYEFSGVVPAGAQITHPSVGEGESWTATIVVDDTVVDSNPDAAIGLYNGAALNTSLSFSGGFSTSAFGVGTIRVFNNYFEAGFLVDAIQVAFFTGPEFLQPVQTATHTLSSLSSDALPGAGTTFAAFPNPASVAYFNLSYLGTAGTVQYFGDLANNSVFSATEAVPEPSTMALIGIGSLAVGVLRKRRDRRERCRSTRS